MPTPGWGHRLSEPARSVVDEPPSADDGRRAFFHVAAAFCLSECAITSAVSKPTITCPPTSGNVPGQRLYPRTDLRPDLPERGQRTPRRPNTTAAARSKAMSARQFPASAIMNTRSCTARDCRRLRRDTTIHDAFGDEQEVAYPDWAAIVPVL